MNGTRKTGAWQHGDGAAMRRPLRSANRRVRFGGVACVVAAFALVTSAVAVASAVPLPARAHPLSGVNALNGPDAVASNGKYVWVANNSSNSVTELLASTGAVVQVIGGAGGAKDEFNAPDAIALDGTHVWVSNGGNNSVTELLATKGALVQVISDPSDGFDGPDAISSDGTHVWVANSNGDSITELAASTGALVQVISDPSDGFGGPSAVASDGTDVWVANGSGDSVTELAASSGALVQVISDPSDGFDVPDALALDGTHVWVANNDGESVTELLASSGALVQVISAASDGFVGPGAIASDGRYVWVANTSGDSVTELLASTGALVRVISDASDRFDVPDAVASDGTHVWVANIDGDSVTELLASMGVLVQVITGATTPPPPPTPTCVGKGACDVATSSPQVICLTLVGCAQQGRPRDHVQASCGTPSATTSCVTVVAYKNGKPAANQPVTVHFLSHSATSSTGSWCQLQSASQLPVSGRTNAQGAFHFAYSTLGLAAAPPIASFCIMRAYVGGAHVILAVDQTNDPAPYKIKAAPRRLSRFADTYSKANLRLSVSSSSPLPAHAVFGDPTAIISEIPSAPGACGAISPFVKKTKSPLGRAFLVYTPSTVFSTPKHTVSCTVVAEEATTGSKSNKVVIYQKKP